MCELGLVHSKPAAATKVQNNSLSFLQGTRPCKVYYQGKHLQVDSYGPHHHRQVNICCGAGIGIGIKDSILSQVLYIFAPD
uniref:Uncharacterized protein n=1 Tax=Anguilla anguilla TaxID=7936 RepID=A0A0E9Q269_ANGAN